MSASEDKISSDNILERLALIEKRLDALESFPAQSSLALCKNCGEGTLRLEKQQVTPTIFGALGATEIVHKCDNCNVEIRSKD